MVFLSSKSRQPSESMTPSSCPATARTQFEAMSKCETHPSVAAVFLTGAASEFHASGLAERKVRWRKDSPEFRKLFVNQ